MPNGRYRRHEPVAAVKSRTAPMRAATIPRGLPDVTSKPANEATRMPPPRTPRTTRSTVLSFLVRMVSLPFGYEDVRTLGKFATEDLVDERARLRESRVDDLPENSAILARTLDEAFPLEHGQVLGHVGSADAKELRKLAASARRLAEEVHQLVPCGVCERREHRGVDGVTLSVVVHDSIIAEFRNFATWQS